DEIRNNPDEGAKRLELACKPGLLALARSLCVDSGDAEELVNRTIAEAVANIDSLLSQSALFGWMCQILVGCHQKDTRRKSHGEIIYPGVVPDVADEDAQEEIYRNLDHSLLREAIARLPEEDREILLLHYFLDIPIAKMAKVLAIPAGTVKSRLHYARKALAAKMGAKVAEAAKKPGIKAVLLALLLCGLTALGAVTGLSIVRSLSSPSAAVEQQADNSKDAGHATSDMRQAEACAATQSATDCYRPPATENSNFSTDNSQGETMNISKKFTRAAMLAAATVATSAAIPATGDTITYDGTAQTINADTHYEVLVVSAATTVTVAQGATLTVDEFIGNAQLTKAGAGTLAVKNFSANSKITASAGTVRFAAGGPTDTTVFDDANTFFHVDASASASMTTAGTLDGNALVSQLADIRGAGHPTASPVGATGTQFNKPWIDAGALNGLNVLDFGTYYKTGTAEDGYGAALCWSEASSAIQEVLIVQADAHDCRIQFLLGCKWPENNSGRTYDYHRGSSGALFNGTYSSASIRNGSIYMDGLSATAATVPSEGFHVFRLVQSGATKASAFADDRETQCRGGIRLAEAIVLTANLDAVSSRRLEMRLQQKWLPGNRPIANLSISSGATLTVDEGVKIIAKGGTLNPSAIVTGAGEAQYEVSAYQYSHPAKSVAKIGSAAVNLRASAARRVRVDEGTLSIVTAASKLTPALHLDATHTGTFTMNNGKVQYWKDIVTLNSSSEKLARQDNAAQRPLRMENAQNGLTVVDFCEIYRPGRWGTGANTPMNMALSTEFTTVRDVFLVVADTDDARSAVTSNRILPQFLLGHNTAYDFHRTGSGQFGILNLSYGCGTSSSTTVALDGASAERNAALPEGFHLVRISPASNAKVNQLCKERSGDNAVYGGLKYGEILLYTGAKLSDAEAADVTDYLLNKWGLPNADHTGVAYESLDIAAGATLGLPPYSSTAALSGAGTVSGDLKLADGFSLKVSTGAPLSVSGALTLPANGTVEISGDVLSYEDNDVVTLLSAGSVSAASPLNYTIVGDFATTKRTVKLFADESGLKARIVKHPFVVVVR
ncbi:MAG: RNA polymerase sigma factor, partial [Kiritimatiellae bacterium]|nr:RNA polymerase sigma factor [Kiritimatiellia bacterium]